MGAQMRGFARGVRPIGGNCDLVGRFVKIQFGLHGWSGRVGARAQARRRAPTGHTVAAQGLPQRDFDFEEGPGEHEQGTRGAKDCVN